MAATLSPIIATLHEAVDACPEAFAAVDGELRVIAWNRAAEQLTGFSREAAIGGPLPHMTAPQLEDLRQLLPEFDRWAGEVPIVVPRRHADGHAIEVSVTSYCRLHDTDGQLIGYGSFFRATRATDARATARNHYSRALAESVRAADVVAALEDAQRDLLPGDRALLLAERNRRWRATLAAGQPQDTADRVTVPDGAGLSRIVAGTAPAEMQIAVDGLPLPALVVPAAAAGQPTAMALVGVTRDQLDVEALELASTIASEASAALARVEAVTELEGKVEILQAIAGVAQAASLDPEEVTQHIARHTASALSCERAAVYLWDGDRGELRLAAYHAADGTADQPGIHDAGTRAAAEMFASVQPFLVQDTRACPWLAGPWSHEEGAVAVHGMPLSAGGSDLGLIVAAHTTDRPRGFTSLCLQVGAALSRQAALAISSAQLLARHADANRALEAHNRRRADYVEGITHDLRTPITAVLGFAKTLRRNGARMNPDDREEALATIERQALRVSRMLDDMMDSARANAGQLRPDQTAEVALHHVVSEALLIATPEQRTRLMASCDPAVRAWGDADQLTRVVQNLIANALRYAPGQSPVEIVVDRIDGMAQLQVVDHGPGVPDGVDLFARFARGDRRGTGLGLYTVKAMVEAHGGSIAITGTPGGGATVTVRLPLFDGDG